MSVAALHQQSAPPADGSICGKRKAVILAELAIGARTAADLARILEMSAGEVSARLAYLRQTGFVTRVDGQAGRGHRATYGLVDSSRPRPTPRLAAPTPTPGRPATLPAAPPVAPLGSEAAILTALAAHFDRFGFTAVSGAAERCLSQIAKANRHRVAREGWVA